MPSTGTLVCGTILAIEAVLLAHLRYRRRHGHSWQWHWLHGLPHQRINTSAAQTCSTDTLGVVFSFLPFVDVASSSATCQRWSTAAAEVSRTGRQRSAFRLPSLQHLGALVRSRLRGLAKEVDLSPTPLVAADRVESLWAALPHLTALKCKIDWRMLSEETTLRFPTSLLSLDVVIVSSANAFQWSHLEVLLSVAVRCPLTRLRIDLPKFRQTSTPPVHTVERLLAVRDTLVDLEMQESEGSWEWAGQSPPRPLWQLGHIAVFRSLTHLTRLHVSEERWSSHELAMLTAEPMPLTLLRSLGSVRTFFDESAFLCLSRLPSLSDLRLQFVSGPASLAQMTNVETVAIALSSDNSTAELTHALSGCTSIRDLCFVSPTASHMAGLSDLLPALTRLSTLRLPQIPIDLACLAAAPNLANTLQHLNVAHPQSVRSLLHVRSLRRLQWAHLELDLDLSVPLELAKGDGETIFLPSLEYLELTVSGTSHVSRDLSRVFGHLPALRRAEMPAARRNADPSQPQHTNTDSIMTLLPQLTSLATLTLFSALSSADLHRAVSSLPHLRELHLFDYTGDLSFLSSPSLAHTLERLSIGQEGHACQIAGPHEFRHLRSLGALRDLQLDIQLAPPLLDSESTGQPTVYAPPQTMLASLRTLRVALHAMRSHWPSSRARPTHSRFGFRWSKPFPRLVIDFARLFGPMPQLRSATITCGWLVQPSSLAAALAHCTRLTHLSLHHGDLTAAPLTSALRPLPRLRSLAVTSSGLDALFFLNTPHLADTLEEIAIHIPRTLSVVPVSDLHGLRSLKQLRRLQLHLRVWRSDETIDEYDIEQPKFQRSIWPYLHYSNVRLDP